MRLKMRLKMRLQMRRVQGFFWPKTKGVLLCARPAPSRARCEPAPPLMPLEAAHIARGVGPTKR